ncbi:MAG: hypothetical protein QMB62_10040 [Oscillospiraceae bacterium]
MTKRKFALICIAALLASLISGCGNEVIVTPKPAATLPAEETMIEKDTQTVQPANSPAATGHPDSKDYSITSGGTTQAVSMDRYDLSFSGDGGPDFGIYIDYSTNDVSDTQHNDGKSCYLVCAFYQDVVSSYITIDYFGGVTEDDAIASLIGFINNTTVTTQDMGQCELESCTAHVIKGQGADGASYTFYVIDTGDGYVAEFLRLDPAEQDLSTGLIASAESIFVN